MRYLHECRVLVLGAELDRKAFAPPRTRPSFTVPAVVDGGLGRYDRSRCPRPRRLTLLERPATEDDETVDHAVAVAADDADFGAFAADYAVRLDRGESPAKAFAAALGESAWEPSLE